SKVTRSAEPARSTKAAISAMSWAAKCAGTYISPEYRLSAEADLVAAPRRSRGHLDQAGNRATRIRPLSPSQAARQAAPLAAAQSQWPASEQRSESAPQLQYRLASRAMRGSLQPGRSPGTASPR